MRSDYSPLGFAPTGFHISMRDLPINFTIKILLASLVSLVTQASAAELSSVDTTIEQGQLRTIVTIDKNTKYHVYRLADPHRLVLYLSDTTLKNIPDNKLLLPSPLKRIRYGIHNNNNLQLIFDLEEPLTYEAGSFYDADKNRLKLTIILKSPNIQAPAEPAAKKIITTKLPQHILVSDSDKVDEEKNIQFDDSDSESIAALPPLPTISLDTQAEQTRNKHPKPVKKKKTLTKIINKLKKYTHVDLQDYGTLGVQSFPKKSTKDSSRIDLGYTSSIGPVGFGVGLVKPVFFVSTKVSDADIKLLVEEESGSSKPAAKLGVALEW